MFNNLMINYITNNNITNNLNTINNINKTLSNKNGSNYFHFYNEHSKEIFKRRNRVNLYEEHSKIINSKKILNLKKKEESSKQNTFEKDTKIEKTMSYNYNNTNVINNKKIKSYNKRKYLMNKIKIYSLNKNMKTITNENRCINKEEKNKTLNNFNLKNNGKKDEKYIKFKKEIFEKFSKNIGVNKFGKKLEINIELNKKKLNETKNNFQKSRKINTNLQFVTDNIIEKIKEKKKEKNITEINKINSNRKENKDIINTIIDKIKENKSTEINKNNSNKEEKKINEKENEIMNSLDKSNKNEEIKNNDINDKDIIINNNDKNIKEPNEYEEEIEKINEDKIIEEEKNESTIKHKEEKKEKDDISHSVEINDNIEKNIEINNNEEIIKKENEEKIKVKSTENFDYYNIENVEEDEEELNYTYFDVTKIKTDSQIPKEYINAIYRNLLKEEDNDINIKPNYESIKSQKEINEQMRSILVDWIIDVHYKFGFTDETLFMTILIIDRYISIKQISKIKFQLLGITALLISCKHEEINLPKIEDFIYITDNAYTKDEVFLMEKDILNAFSFELLYPSPIKFYEILILKFNFDKTKYLMGKYLMETFLIDLKWIKYRPSIIACACIYIVMKFFKMENYHEAYNKKY